MAVESWLIDKSAFIRLAQGEAADIELWSRRIERGLVRISTLTLLEIGFSARSGAEHRLTLLQPPLSYMPLEYLSPAAEKRATQVQLALAERGQHRAPSIPDLLIAAIAEDAGLTVLAVDRDFDLISKVTGQPVCQLALNGPAKTRKL